LVIDGSGSISSSEWSIIVGAVSKAVNETIPHDGSVELSIVQFGYSGGIGARTELTPTVIDNATFAGAATRVQNVSKMGGSTSMADGLFLAWKDISSSPNFQESGTRQVIDLASDGIPNIRNNNATGDLDGNGIIDAYDDVVSVIDSASNQGLDEVDVEGIGISSTAVQWFRDNACRPRTGIIAPPFSKPGWIRLVADVDEFANTLGAQFQAIIGGQEEIWTPSAPGALLAVSVTAGVTALVSALASAVTNPDQFPSQALAQKASELCPETIKKWLSEFVSSKRKLVIGPRRALPYALTRFEVASYVVSLTVLTLAFSFVRVVTFDEILTVIPTVLATSILVEFTKNYVISVVARIKGVWTEHRPWFLGLALFIFSSFILKVPFSSPSRLTHNAPSFTRKSLGIVAAAQVLITLVFAFIFYGFFINGYTLIGNVGIVMCLTMAFFDSLPIPPMNGKDLYDWSRLLWISLFVTSFTLYALVVFIL
jgi:Zn-dependent protease